jgi:hypothetical protein
MDRHVYIEPARLSSLEDGGRTERSRLLRRLPCYGRVRAQNVKKSGHGSLCYMGLLPPYQQGTLATCEHA